jgi:hypothetical protein
VIEVVDELTDSRLVKVGGTGRMNLQGEQDKKSRGPL